MTDEMELNACVKLIALQETEINKLQAKIEELETKVQLQSNYIKRLQIESIEGKTDE